MKFLVLLPLLGLATATAQVANDAYNQPQDLGVLIDGQLIEGSYQGATIDPGEARLFPTQGRGPTRPPRPGVEEEPQTSVKQSIWFTFQVPTSGIWEVNAGYPDDWAPIAASDPMVCVDAPLATAQSLFPVATNPDTARCALLAGTIYRLGLRTTSQERSLYEVRFSRLPSPANDSLASAPSQPGPVLTLDPTGSTLESGEVPSLTDPVIGSAWIRWTAPSSGRWWLRRDYKRLEVISFPPPSPSLFPPPREVVTDDPMDWPERLGWPGSQAFALFQNGAPVVSLAQSHDWILFEATAGTEYAIAGYERWNGTGPLDLVIEPASPADHRTTARDLGDESSLNVSGHLVGATRDPDETIPPSMTDAATVWFRWTARGDGPVQLEVEYSAVENQALAITAFSGEAPIGAKSGAWNFEWAFDATAGTTYDFQIAGTAGIPTAFRLRLLAPEPADHFANAIPLRDLTTVSTVGATLEPGEPATAEGEGSVWLKWQTDEPQAVNVIFRQLQALNHWHETKARLEIFRGTSLASLEPDSLGTQFLALPGETYYFRVLASAETDGSGQIELRRQPLSGSLEDLLTETGAILDTRAAGSDAQASSRLAQALALAPEDPRVRLASAYLEFRAAAATGPGKIIVARVINNYSSPLLPLAFIPSTAAGEAGTLPADQTLTEFLAAFDRETWPHLEAALGHLMAIAEPAPTWSHYTLPVYPRGPTGPASNLTDAHDRRTLAAMVMALRAGVDYLQSLDGGLPAQDFFGWLCDGSPSLEEMLERHPRFLTFGETDRRASAITWARAAVVQADLGRSFYQAPLVWAGSDQSLFTSTSLDPLARWTNWLRSASGPVVASGSSTVDLSRWFSGPTPPRALLPQVSGNGLLAHTVADVTFNQLLPAITAD